ncbi:mRNA capping enzyme, alpha subunit [Eremomyces bilateralis CBS 781.70]|uniref:mRNA-capping enzyme subunit alpha n=1 Tax=Eremomyces bilateralis CBS 781.70 TaxID=1392243 RepID=A0A6G1G399_9PEZI|nr:mRNA capping enzyme, alpha subunit [Eremomyces bilateralis CBS 781.70]KAF1812587.1 mRNA capping enzyme, alpha subunit [Eremomyces bilateralis CBS 781.70]
MSGPVPQIPGIKCEPALAEEFRKEVAELLHRRQSSFPGAQPVSFARHHLDELQKRDYYLCEKTDGIRCLLYCTEDERGNEIHYLIDRKNDYYFLQTLHFPHQDDPEFREFHRGTLIDGELVNDTLENGRKQLRYLVFDCIVLDGELLLQKPLDKRIGRFGEFVFKPYQKFLKRYTDALGTMPFEVKFKTMEKPYGIEMMFRDKLPNLPHGNDGLVFTCKETPYVMGTDDHILKWKPAHENSIDFRLRLGEFPLMSSSDPREGRIPDYDAKPTFELYVYHGGKDYQSYAPLFVTDDDWESMKRIDEPIDGRIIECYKAEQGRWRFKRESDGSPRFRDDKSDANHISTVHKVMQSIDDAVSEQDLLQVAGAVYKAWKQRHPEELRR